jgi:DNA polymerase-3 subunit delta
VRSYRDFISDLKNDSFGSTLFFYGEENLLTRWAVTSIINRYTQPEDREFTVTEINAEETGTDEIIRAASTYSMFPGKRIVIVRNMPMLHRRMLADEKEDSKRILDMAGQDQDASMIVFTLDSMYSGELNAFAKKLAKAGDAYEFARLDRRDLKSFINKRLRAGRRIMTSRDMDHLIDISGYFNRESEYTLDDLESDLSKLVNAGDEERITSDLIEDVMVGDDERFVFDFINALTEDDKSRAMKMLESMMEKDPAAAVRTNSLLTGQLEMMYDALELGATGLSIKQMAKKTGSNEFRFKKAYTAARKFGRQRVERAIFALYDNDRKFRCGEMELPLAMELFVASV